MSSGPRANAPSGSARSAHIGLVARGLSARLGGRAVLQALDLHIAARRWTCVVGANGAGKSTLLKALAGLTPCQGELLWQGRPLHAGSAAQRARQLAWLGQGEAAADDLCVDDVVMLGRMPHRAWWAQPTAADQAAVHQALAQTGCLALRQRRLGALSDGERQRVLLARALAVQAPVLLLDEPLVHLDPPHQADWLALMRQLVAQGTTVLCVLHELHLALQADDLLILDQGRLAYQGACAEPATHRALEQAFDQRVTVLPVQDGWTVLPRG